MLTPNLESQLAVQTATLLVNGQLNGVIGRALRIGAPLRQSLARPLIVTCREPLAEWIVARQGARRLRLPKINTDSDRS
jgi:hypothetical protein